MNPIISLDSITSFQPYRYMERAICVMVALVFVYSLLVFRQALQMTNVLPTPLSPVVKVMVSLYVAIALGALILGIGIVISSF